jgi:hypothetical protein
MSVASIAIFHVPRAGRALPYRQAELGADAHVRNRMQKSENIQKPEDYRDHYHGVQDGFDRSLHRYEAVHQPEQYAYHH